MHKSMFIALVLACGGALTAAAYGAPVPDQIDTILGKKAQALPTSVYKYSWPRTDLSVSVDGTPIAPGLALGSWAAFAPFKQQSWVMGDLVLLQSEVEPVIKALQAGRFEIMAIHNHLINENPRVMYLHYRGRAILPNWQGAACCPGADPHAAPSRNQARQNRRTESAGVDIKSRIGPGTEG
jgi:hypothetical protein